VGAAITGAPADKNDAGLVSFDDTMFTVDANGFVQLAGGSVGLDSLTGDDGVVVTGDGAGNINLVGSVVANATNAKPLYVDGDAGTFTQSLELQVASAIAATPADTNDAGIASFNSDYFAVDGNGFVTLADVGSFTTGSVIFWGASNFAEDNPNFFWDDTNNRLGLGTTTPLDTFHIVGAMELDHTAIENDDHAIEIVCNAAGFSDVKALDIDYITGAMGSAQDEEAIVVNIDETASVGGIVAGYLVLSTSEGSATVNGYETGINVNPVVQESGTFGDADYIRNIAVDVTAALASGGAGAITAFVADNDTFTIGDAASFDELEVILTTPASGGGIAPTFEYSTGAASFATFSPADGTNGFRNTGAILWDSSTLAGWVAAASGNFEIRITRTRNVLATSPVLDEIQISATTEFKWDKNGDVNINSLTLVVDLSVPNGGTGASTLTGVLTGNGTSSFTASAVTDNTVIRGSTSNLVQDSTILSADNGDFTNTGTSTSASTAFIHKNTSNTAGAGVDLQLRVGGASASDPYMRFAVEGVLEYSLGIDNSDSDALCLTNTSTLNGTNYIRVNSTGEINYPFQPAFQATNSTTDTNQTGNGTNVTVQFDTEVLDQGGDYDNATYTFTAPVTGLYNLSTTVMAAALTAAMTEGQFKLVTTGKTFYQQLSPGACMSSAARYSFQITQQVYMIAADTAKVDLNILNGVGDTASILGTTNFTTFSGNLEC